MIKQKIANLLQRFEPDVKRIVIEVILLEYARLDTKKPKGLTAEIREIIEEEASQQDDN